MAVESRLQGIQARISADDPFNRLPPVTFVDAQAVVLWWLLDVFDEVMKIVPATKYVPAFRIQDVAYNETIGVLAGKYGESRTGVESKLRGCSNLRIDDPLMRSSTAYLRAAELRRQLCVLAGEDPGKVKPNRHLGEAEILAVIEQGYPGAYIVTGDGGAVRAAHLIGVKPVDPFSFVAAVTPTVVELTEVWQAICERRACVSAAGARTCQTTLTCASTPPDPHQRCVVSPNAPYRDAETLATMMSKRIDTLVDSL